MNKYIIAGPRQVRGGFVDAEHWAIVEDVDGEQVSVTGVQYPHRQYAEQVLDNMPHSVGSDRTRWYVHLGVHGDPSIVTDLKRPAFTKVCDVSTSPADYGRGNARLLAEAPAMLEALRDAVRLIEHLGGNAGHQRKAIERATTT